MKTIYRFETEDGKEFTDRIAARQHEVTEETIKKIVALVSTSFATNRIESVIRDMVFQADAMAAIWTHHRKTYPKDAKVAA